MFITVHDYVLLISKPCAFIEGVIANYDVIFRRVFDIFQSLLHDIVSRSIYVFENISNKTDVETIYDYLRERFEINKLLCEYVDSIMPLQNYSRTSRERYRNNILFAFSVTTAINIIVGYFKYIVNIESTTKQGLVFFSVFFALLLVFNAGIIILTAISSAQARKQLINRTKSNCVKNVDKHKRL